MCAVPTVLERIGSLGRCGQLGPSCQWLLSGFLLHADISDLGLAAQAAAQLAWVPQSPSGRSLGVASAGAAARFVRVCGAAADCNGVFLLEDEMALAPWMSASFKMPVTATHASLRL